MCFECINFNCLNVNQADLIVFRKKKSSSKEQIYQSRALETKEIKSLNDH
jgi:hypothetical protein